jgi:hypothetical protein
MGGVHFKDFEYNRQLRKAVCAGVTENPRPCASADERNLSEAVTNVSQYCARSLYTIITPMSG